MPRSLAWTLLPMLLALPSCSASRAGAEEPCGPSVSCAPGLACGSLDGADFRCHTRCWTRAECAAGLDCSGGVRGLDGEIIFDVVSGVVCVEHRMTPVGEPCVVDEDCVGLSRCSWELAEPRCVAECPEDEVCPSGTFCSGADLRHCNPVCTLTGPTACDQRAGRRLCVPWRQLCWTEENAASCYNLDGSSRMCPLGTICGTDGACVTEEEAQAIWAAMAP